MTARVVLPKLHPGQREVFDHRGRFTVVQCGRRWGKTTLGTVLAAVPAMDGHPVGWFAPTYKYLMDTWRELCAVLAPAIAHKSEQEKRLALVTGGIIDFWTMDTSDPGRGRKYKRAILDECGIVRDLTTTYQQAIRPTLTDLKGDCWFLGTPKGRREFHALFQRGEQQEPGWKSFRRKTVENPLMDPAEVEDARRSMPEQAFRQEYEGMPADDGGNPFGMNAIAACFGEVEPGEIKCFGVDLARAQDWTVVYGLTHAGHLVVADRWQHVPWNETMARIVRIVGDRRALIDSTGVGDAVVEQLQRQSPKVEGFKFSALSKQQLMERLAAALHAGEVRFNDPVLRSELECFEYEYTKTGVRYSAPAGLHDDCVCAFALAVRGGDTEGESVYVGGASAGQVWG